MEAKHDSPVEIVCESLTSEVSLRLIGELNEELTALYPEPGANHFELDPDEVGTGRGAFIVVRWFGKPVGCGALRWLRDPALVRELGPKVGEIKRMFVARQARGKGIGLALLGRLELEARKLGITRLVLETGTRQIEALALYRRFGFTTIPAYGEYLVSVDTSVCMEKML